MSREKKSQPRTGHLPKMSKAAVATMLVAAAAGTGKATAHTANRLPSGQKSSQLNRETQAGIGRLAESVMSEIGSQPNLAAVYLSKGNVTRIGLGLLATYGAARPGTKELSFSLVAPDSKTGEINSGEVSSLTASEGVVGADGRFVTFTRDSAQKTAHGWRLESDTLDPAGHMLKHVAVTYPPSGNQGQVDPRNLHSFERQVGQIVGMAETNTPPHPLPPAF